MTIVSNPVASPREPKSESLPRLSVIIPCRNEGHFIGSCLDSILASDYSPNAYEVLVIDGMSTDGTRSAIRKCIRQHANVKLLDNPKQITPAALNIGIRAAAGEFVCRVDAHARVSSDYLRRCVQRLCDGAAENVGGSMRTIPSKRNLVAHSIALCMSHEFGVGGSAFRLGRDKAKFTDTVFGGCYRKQTLERLGLYNENLRRTQDFELNQRLRNSGGRILLDPAIHCDYFASPNLLRFMRQNVQDGLWSVLPFLYCKRAPVRLRHLAPLTFVATAVALASGGFLFRPFWLLLLLQIASYAAVSLAFSTHLSWRKRDYRLLFAMPLVFAVRHFSYGFGSLVALFALFGRWASIRREASPRCSASTT